MLSRPRYRFSCPDATVLDGGDLFLANSTASALTEVDSATGAVADLPAAQHRADKSGELGSKIDDPRRTVGTSTAQSVTPDVLDASYLVGRLMSRYRGPRRRAIA